MAINEMDTIDLPFEDVFPPTNPYTKARLTTIHGNRTTLSGKLFIDYLLTTVCGLSSSPYPPRSTSSLTALYTQLQTLTSIDSLKKFCLIYYLLLDFDSPRPDGPSPTNPDETVSDNGAASTYARKCHLPHTFVHLMCGLWGLDNLDLELGIAYISSPGVTAPAPEKILELLDTNGTPELVTLFVQRARIPLSNTAMVEVYFRALCALSIVQAFTFTRGRTADERQRLFGVLVDSVVARGGEGLKLLAGLPMKSDEEQWFEERIMGGSKNRKNAVARDAVVVRWLHTGRFEDALKAIESVETQQQEEVDGLSWGVLGKAVRKGLGPRANDGTGMES